MAEERPSGLARQPVTSLADLNLSEESLDSILAHVGRLGVAALDGWDAAGTTLVDRGSVATFGITDDRVKSIDQQQYNSGKGPCVDAVKEGSIQYYDATDSEPRWRQFAEAAGEEGIYSVFSVPLKINDEGVGALNFYSTERDALRPGQREEASAFGAQAAVVMGNAKEFVRRGSQIEQLNEGLNSRTMIGQATGLLMAQEGLASDEAFQKLVHVSQTSNMKLRQIAQRYVTTWESRAKADMQKP